MVKECHRYVNMSYFSYVPDLFKGQVMFLQAIWVMVLDGPLDGEREEIGVPNCIHTFLFFMFLPKNRNISIPSKYQIHLHYLLYIQWITSNNNVFKNNDQSTENCGNILMNEFHKSRWGLKINNCLRHMMIRRKFLKASLFFPSWLSYFWSVSCFVPWGATFLFPFPPASLPPQ